MPKRRAELLVEVTEAAVKIVNGDNVLTLSNAAGLEDSEDGADFIVTLDDIAYWDAPHDKDEIDIETVQKIVRAIELEFDKLGLGIAFE